MQMKMAILVDDRSRSPDRLVAANRFPSILRSCWDQAVARCDDWINSWINGAIDATGVGLSLSHRVTRVLWRKKVCHTPTGV